MSKERKFHELIEQQNQEEKQRVWEKICAMEAERAREQEQPPVIPQKRVFPWKKWVAIATCSLAVLGFGVFAMVKFIPWGVHANNDGENNGRYYTNQSYEIVETTDTMKDYAQNIGKNLLYFDWYAETDHLEDKIWKLNETSEIICFQEEIVDINTGCMIDFSVTDVNVELEGFSSDKQTNKETILQGVKVYWQSDNDRAISNFEYEGYRYYLRVKEPMDENYILSLVEELLP